MVTHGPPLLKTVQQMLIVRFIVLNGDILARRMNPCVWINVLGRPRTGYLTYRRRQTAVSGLWRVYCISALAIPPSNTYIR